MQWHTMQWHTMQWHTMQWHTMQWQAHRRKSSRHQVRVEIGRPGQIGEAFDAEEAEETLRG